MPTYEYKCPRCMHTAEVEASEPPKRVKCQICGYRTMRRVFAPIPVHFKGEGFTKSTNKPKE